MEIIKTGKSAKIRVEPGISRSIAIFTFLVSDRLRWRVVTKPQREESSLWKKRERGGRERERREANRIIAMQPRER